MGRGACSSSARCVGRRHTAASGSKTIRGFREIIDGKHDELPEQAFYMVGAIEGAVEKGKRIGGEAEEEREEPEPDVEVGEDAREPEPAGVT